jgi:hypothetical protein
LYALTELVCHADDSIVPQRAEQAGWMGNLASEIQEELVECIEHLRNAEFVARSNASRV